MSARITVIGNVASNPMSRQTGSGRTVTNFRIASTERRLDRESERWVDGNKFFVGVACWSALAENVAASVRIGMPVVVTGRISQRTWTDEHDQTRFSYEIQAETVAPDLARGTADFQRVSRSQGPSIALTEEGLPEFGHSEDEFEVVDRHDGRHPADGDGAEPAAERQLVGALSA